MRPPQKSSQIYAYVCNPRSPLRSRSATSRSALSFCSIVYCYARFTLLSAPPHFRPAPLRFPLRSRSAHMLCA